MESIRKKSHVPDPHRALAEVRRVLKPDGVFYCATYGKNGVITVPKEYGMFAVGKSFTEKGIHP